jgi:hypothetical protein
MYGGQPVEMGNGAMFANANPLNDPRLKIKGGEPWTKRPLLPGEKDPAEDIPFQFLPPSPGQGAGLVQALPGMYPNITTSMNPGINSGMTPMGNAGFYAGPQLGQSVLKGYANKIVS